jgi:glycosyltransferase involved in cell wall biosynthesis
VVVPYYNLGPFLPDTLASLDKQTYPALEVLVINDGSTDPESIRVFEEQQPIYPHFRFLSQANAGIGATRNRGLEEARGEYFLPMDADNVAFPPMVERLVRGIRRNPDLAAMTCYFLAFRETENLADQEYAYAYRPPGGPRVMASFRNVYGDANAIFRTQTFRAVGGYETERDTSWEDWEAFLKLVNAGHRLGVVPDYLFAYRCRETGFSRVTNTFSNHQRVLRQFIQSEHLPMAEKIALWTALVSMQKRHDELCAQNRFLQGKLASLGYRVTQRLEAVLGKVPLVKRGVKGLLRTGRRAWKYVAGGGGKTMG